MWHRTVNAAWKWTGMRAWQRKVRTLLKTPHGGKVVALDKGVDGLQSPILKFLPGPVVAALLERTRARDGDLIFFGADKAKVVNDSLGALRNKIGHSEFGRTHGLLEDKWCPLWVVDFPMFEHDDEAQRWVAVHHPFTAPKDGHENLMDTDPSQCVAKAYDMVLNGWEIGGGSVRIHREEVQSKVFRALKIGPEEARAVIEYFKKSDHDAGLAKADAH